jgi:energy-converting hydrogenase B subunit D
MPELALDVVLCALLTGIAWSALSSPDLFRSIVLYIAFGLLVALVWVRLGAPDIALAEAAIGAGITGALLLDAAHQFGSRDGRRKGGDD